MPGAVSFRAGPQEGRCSKTAPRLTNNLDLVLNLKKSDVHKLLKAFPLEEFYCPPEEIIITEISRTARGQFNLIHNETGFRVDVYLAGKDTLHQWSLANTKPVQVEDQTVMVAPPEYVFLRQLEYYRESRSDKHLRDIAGILEVSGNEVNPPWLEEQISKRQLHEEWLAAKLYRD